MIQGSKVQGTRRTFESSAQFTGERLGFTYMYNIYSHSANGP